MSFVVSEIIRLKNRGVIISAPCGSAFKPKAGEKLSCGKSSWLIRSVENYDGYMRWLLLAPLGEPKEPQTGYVLSVVKDPEPIQELKEEIGSTPESNALPLL